MRYCVLGGSLLGTRSWPVALGLVAPTGEGFGPVSHPTPAPTRRVGGNSRGAAPRLYSLLSQSYSMLAYRYDYESWTIASPNSSSLSSVAAVGWRSRQQRQRRRQHGRRTDGGGQCRTFEGQSGLYEGYDHISRQPTLSAHRNMALSCDAGSRSSQTGGALWSSWGRVRWVAPLSGP